MSLNALCASSRQTIGERPEKPSSKRLSRGFDASEAFRASSICVLSQLNTSGLRCSGGKRYIMPGSMRRSASPPYSMRRRQSMILPSLPTRTRFELRPMSSTASFKFTLSPSSLCDIMSTKSRRSQFGCVSFSILAPTRYLRRSMQNIGGSAGFSKLCCVRAILPLPAPALMSSRRFSPLLRTESKICSRSGCCTLSIRAPSNLGRSSDTRAESITVSSAMTILHANCVQLVYPLGHALQVQPAEQRL